MATCYYQIIFKGNEAYICVDFPDSGFTNLTSTFFTDGENVVVGTPYVLEDGVMTFHFSPDDFDIINDGVIRYIIEYKVDGEDKMLSTNSNAYLKTLSDFSGKTKEDYWEEGYESGYTCGQEECSGGSEDLIANLQGDYFVIPEGTKSIRNTAFAEDCFSSITIPNSVEYIGDYAFASNICLSSITVPSSVSGMGYGVFYSCYNLKDVTFEATCSDIMPYTFGGCYSLTGLTIPASVTTIGNDAFENCTSLTSITIPENVLSLSDYVFRNCSGLTEMTFKGLVPPTINTGNSFGDTAYTYPIYVPCDSYDAYVQAFGPDYAPRVMCREG